MGELIEDIREDELSDIRKMFPEKHTLWIGLQWMVNIIKDILDADAVSVNRARDLVGRPGNMIARQRDVWTISKTIGKALCREKSTYEGFVNV